MNKTYRVCVMIGMTITAESEDKATEIAKGAALEPQLVDEAEVMDVEEKEDE